MASSETITRTVPLKTDYRASAVERAIREIQRAKLVDVGPRGSGKNVVHWTPEGLWAEGCLLCLADIGVPMTEAGSTIPLFTNLVPYKSTKGVALSGGVVVGKPFVSEGSTFGGKVQAFITVCGDDNFPDFHTGLVEHGYQIELGYDWSPWGSIRSRDADNGEWTIIKYRPAGCVKPKPTDLLNTRSRSVTFPIGLLMVLGNLWADSKVKIEERLSLVSKETAASQPLQGPSAAVFV